LAVGVTDVAALALATDVTAAVVATLAAFALGAACIDAFTIGVTRLAGLAIGVSAARVSLAYTVGLGAAGGNVRTLSTVTHSAADQLGIRTFVVAVLLVFAHAAVFFAITAPGRRETLGVITAEGVADAFIALEFIAVVLAVSLTITRGTALAAPVITCEGRVVGTAGGVHAFSILADLIFTTVVVARARAVTVVWGSAATGEVLPVADRSTCLGCRGAFRSADAL